MFLKCEILWSHIISYRSLLLSTIVLYIIVANGFSGWELILVVRAWSSTATTQLLCSFTRWIVSLYMWKCILPFLLHCYIIVPFTTSKVLSCNTSSLIVSCCIFTHLLWCDEVTALSSVCLGFIYTFSSLKVEYLRHQP